MSGELAAPRRLAIPATGELIDLDAATDTLAGHLDDIRDLEGALRGAKRELAQEILARMDTEATWTVEAGPYKLVGESPNRVDYDPHELLTALRALPPDAISPRALDAAVQRVEQLKVSKQGVNKLLKLGGPVADAVRGAERPVERERRVSVKRIDRGT